MKQIPKWPTAATAGAPVGPVCGPSAPTTYLLHNGLASEGAGQRRRPSPPPPPEPERTFACLRGWRRRWRSPAQSSLTLTGRRSESGLRRGAGVPPPNSFGGWVPSPAPVRYLRPEMERSTRGQVQCSWVGRRRLVRRSFAGAHGLGSGRRGSAPAEAAVPSLLREGEGGSPEGLRPFRKAPGSLARRRPAVPWCPGEVLRRCGGLRPRAESCAVGEPAGKHSVALRGREWALPAASGRTHHRCKGVGRAACRSEKLTELQDIWFSAKCQQGSAAHAVWERGPTASEGMDLGWKCGNIGLVRAREGTFGFGEGLPGLRRSRGRRPKAGWTGGSAKAGQGQGQKDETGRRENGGGTAATGTRNGNRVG